MGLLVMLPVDGSPHSQRAFEFYASQISQPSDTVILIHLFSPPDLPSLSLRNPKAEVWGDWIDKFDKALKFGTDVSERYEKLCKELKVKTEVIVHSDRPGPGICSFIKDISPDLVIMGNRGLSKARRMLMGSVTDYVIHHANVAVTLVPPIKDKDKDAKDSKDAK